MPRYLFPALIYAEVTSAPRGAGTSVPTAAQTAAHPEHFVTPLEKDFPSILKKIEALWGYPELNLYFLRLTIDDRGDREGFPTAVWDDLQTLMRLHQDLFPD